MMAQTTRTRKGCAFLGFDDMAPHLGGQIPQNPNFGGVNRHFQAKLNTEKHAYYQHYCIDSNQILHSDKDHQMPLMGGLNARIIYQDGGRPPCWQKSKNRHMSAMVAPIATKFGTLTQFDPLDHSDICNVLAAYLCNHEFLDSTDSLERVGCCTCVIFLFLTKFLRNMSNLFMIRLPNDYLTIAKVVISLCA